MRLPIPLAVAIEWYIGQIASTTAQSQSRLQGFAPCMDYSNSPFIASTYSATAT